MKKVYKILIGIGILIVAGVIISLIVNQSQVRKFEKQEEEKYLGTFLRFDKNRENANECLDDKVNKEFNKQKQSCEEVYSERKAVYDNCRKDFYWEDHYGCITWSGANYEEVDCSDENIETKIRNDNSYSCSSKLEDGYNYLINYEKGQVQSFINEFDESKYIVKEKEIENLFTKFPNETQNYKLYKRLVEEVENKGYEVEKEEFYFSLATEELEKQSETLLNVKNIERENKEIILMVESENLEMAEFGLALTQIIICGGDKVLNDIVEAGGTFYINTENEQGELLLSSEPINITYCKNLEKE